MPNPVPSAALAVASLLIAFATARAAPRARAEFVARNICAVTARLDDIHRRGPVTTSKDRFIVLSLPGEGQHYVQCLFQDRDTRMLCEASSGAYRYRSDEPVRLRQSEQSVAALRALGYEQANPRENFSRVIDLGTPPDTRTAARLMLAALRDAYGAGPDTAIEITAPRSDTAAAARCRAPRP